MAKNVYIHIPFCKSKCNYCTFVSFPCLQFKDSYVAALKKQIQAEYKGEKVETLYFGGGTPSNLSVEDFKTLISLFNFENNAEITTEINPEGIDKDYLVSLKSLGINRLSIGSQSFDEDILKTIGRRHNSKQVEKVVNMAKEAGFDNISLDLIYGLPNQSNESFKADLKKVIDLNVQHISLYGLKIEEGCNFYNSPPQNLPDLDTQADMYLAAVDILTQNSFEHYEISNFSKAGFNSRHNLNYWDNNTYYGFGLSASGYLDKVRYTNQTILEKYIENPLSKISEQKLKDNEILEEAIFLGFRKMAGINVDEINNKFGIDFNKKYSKILQKYLSTGHLIKTSNGYALSIEGVLVSNDILADFID